MDQNTILSAAEACNSTFTSLLDSGPLHQAEQSDLTEAVQEERARFRIWATHIGTFAEQHASLDYRLRESETVRQLVITQLRLLLGSLSLLSKNLHSGKRKLDTLENIRNSSNEAYQQDISSEMCVISPEDNLSSIRGAISRLQRLSRAIRLPGAISQTSKAASFSPSAQFESEQQEFETFALRMIQIKFELATEALQKRLGKANEARRRLFLYRRHRQEILSGKRHTSPHRRPMPFSPTEPFSTSIYQDTKAKANRDESSSTIINDIEDRNAQLSVEKATTFAESKFEPDTSVKAVSSLGGTSIASFFEKSRLPLPPKALHSGDYFECPYCCQLTPNKFLEKKHWRKHLVQDLEPYLCLFEDCEQSDTRFRDQNQWILHLRSHAMRWSCRLPGHPNNQRQMTFVVEKEYIAHLKQHSNASSLSDAQIQLLVQQSGRFDPIPIRSCPLCHESLETITENVNTKDKRITSSDPSCAVSMLNMYKHITSHLMLIASYSLPWSDDVDENIVSDFGPSTLTGSSVSDQSLQQGTKTIREGPRLAEDAEPLDFDNRDRSPGDYTKGEWDFVPDESYEGQLNDKNLKAFMDRALGQAQLTNRPTPKSNTRQAVYVAGFYVEPRRVEQLMGRDELLEEMDHYLLPSSNESLTSLALVGLGGIGKTAVALEYAYSRREKFQAIIWLDATSVDNIINDFASAAERLGFADKWIVDPTERWSLFLQWLYNPQPLKGWLLIFDHIQSWHAMRNFWPHRGPGSILITSRNSLLDRSVTKTLHVKPLALVDGRKLMRNLSREEAFGSEYEALEEIMHQIGSLPLAIERISSLKRRRGLTYKDVLELAQEVGIGVISGFAPFLDDAAYHNSTLYWSFEQLGSGANALLGVVSFLNPDEISEDILRDPKTNLSWENYPVTALDYVKARTELLHSSLVSMRHSQKSIDIHRLVQATFMEGMEKEQVDKAFGTAIKLVESKWPFQDFGDQYSENRPKQCAVLVPHVLHMCRSLEKISKTHDISHIGEQFTKLLNDAKAYLRKRGDLDIAKTLSRVSNNLSRTASG